MDHGYVLHNKSDNLSLRKKNKKKERYKLFQEVLDFHGPFQMLVEQPLVD